MKKILPEFILVIISALLIFYRFAEIPKYLAYDEVEFAKLALSLNGKPYIPYSQLATGHSTFYFYILLFSLKTFGINTLALRLPAAVFGILSVLLFYLVTKKIFKSSFAKASEDKQWLPFLLSMILMTSRWFLNFSRFSFEVTFLLFLELTSIFFLLNSNVILGRIRQSAETTPESLSDSGRTPSSLARMTYVALSGLFAGFAFLSYTPGRIFFLIPLSFLVIKYVKLITKKQILSFLVPLIIVTAPLNLYFLTFKDTRIDQQFFLRNHEMTFNQKAEGLWNNISSITLMFFTSGDLNGRHNYPGKPALNPILGILFLIGIAISIKNWKKSFNSFFIFYFFLSILPALMTYPWENPNMLRTYTVLPSVVYFIGNAIFVLYTTALKIIVNKKKFVSCFLFLVVLFSAYYELRTYFKYQSIVFKQSFEIKSSLEKAIKVKLNP